MNASITSNGNIMGGNSMGAFSSSSQPSPNSTNTSAPAPAQPKSASTDPFLKDFTLVAEAAKRAQVAVMTRDFEECGFF